MVSYIISRLVVLTFGTLYPAYSSYKAVKTRNVKEYAQNFVADGENQSWFSQKNFARTMVLVKWMMYWIVFALFTCVETIADIFASILPFYYEAKILFIFWLISPWTKGATYLYRKFVHPTLTKREQEIDDYLAQASDKGLKAIKKVGQNGLTIAANAVMQSAMKGQSTLIDQLRTYSTYYNTSPMKQLEGVPEEPAEEVEEAKEAKEHMVLLRSEEETDTEEDEDSIHFRNKQVRQSLESLDNRLREERDERDTDDYEEPNMDHDGLEQNLEHDELEQERLERERLEWEQQEQERQERQERYRNRRLLQSTHELPPSAPRQRRSNAARRERNFTTSLTREEFDNASNSYTPDDEPTLRRAASLRRPYASTENLSSRRPLRKHEQNTLPKKNKETDTSKIGKETETPKQKTRSAKEPLERTSSERSSSRATRSSSRLHQKPTTNIQITRY